MFAACQPASAPEVYITLGASRSSSLAWHCASSRRGQRSRRCSTVEAGAALWRGRQLPVLWDYLAGGIGWYTI